MKEKEEIPFHEATIERTEQTMTNGQRINLDTYRSVEVWDVKNTERHLHIRIRRATLDNKISLLEFGLSREAARALITLLQKKL